MSSTSGNNSKGEYMTVGFYIYNPVNPAPGSPVLFYAQSLIVGQVVGSSAILSGIFFLIAIANKLFGLDVELTPAPNQNARVVRLTLPELQNFLSSFKNDPTPLVSDTDNLSAGDGTVGGRLEPGEFGSTPNDSLIVSLAAWSSYSTLAYTPSVVVNVPLFTLPTVRGSIPLLILETLVTIFARAVTSPDGE